ncbi:hypothetical protein AHF37_03914 [Paragonimus kellicotti]|nr:hypothetical protein AHF37_03914 [Paragonimus kellicotti]
MHILATVVLHAFNFFLNVFSLDLIVTSTFARNIFSFFNIFFHLKLGLVTYSDSDSSSSSDKFESVERIEQKCDDLLQYPVAKRPCTDDYFNLTVSEDNDTFWTTTGHDAELLPTAQEATFSISSATRSPQSPCNSLSSNRTFNPPSHKPDELRSLSIDCFAVAFSLQPEIFNFVPPPAPHSQTVYTRLSLAWPLLSICGPFKRNPDGSCSSQVVVWKLPAPRNFIEGCKPQAVYDPLPTPISSGQYCWSSFSSDAGSTEIAFPTGLFLITASSLGRVEVWDLEIGSTNNLLNASALCGGLLRCAAIPSIRQSVGHHRASILISGRSGPIGLWDLRSSDRTHPQCVFSHPCRYSTPTSDLLWLTDTHFSSTSDLVDRDVCDVNVAVWDTRFKNRPISHQIYQERWGCVRMALRGSSENAGRNPEPRFAVQTHGNAIVEVYGTHKSSNSSLNSNTVSYGETLEIRRTRRMSFSVHLYSAHCQAHPLGLAYSSDGCYLASGSWEPNGPVIWSSGKSTIPRGQQIACNTPAERGHRHRTMVTDVVWIPSPVMQRGQYGLIAVQETGAVFVYTYQLLEEHTWKSTDETR